MGRKFQRSLFWKINLVGLWQRFFGEILAEEKWFAPGLLYAPRLGTILSQVTQTYAYRQALYALSHLWILGYAKDLTAQAAAMTAAGMKKVGQRLTVYGCLQDPANYAKSPTRGS